MEIKEGTLVKAWDDYDNQLFLVGAYSYVSLMGYVIQGSDEYWNSVEVLPADLAKQLEELGR